MKGAVKQGESWQGTRCGVDYVENMAWKKGAVWLGRGASWITLERRREANFTVFYNVERIF